MALAQLPSLKCLRSYWSATCVVLLVLILSFTLVSARWAVVFSPGTSWVAEAKGGAIWLYVGVGNYQIRARPWKSVYLILESSYPWPLLLDAKPLDAMPFEWGVLKKWLWPSYDSQSRCHYFCFPLLYPLIVMAFFTYKWVWAPLGKSGSGKCVQCGYDLTGNASGICSECGSRIAAMSTSDGLEANNKQRKLLITILLVSVVGIVAFMEGKRSSFHDPRYVITSSGQLLYVLDQVSGMIRVFDGDRLVREINLSESHEVDLENLEE